MSFYEVANKIDLLISKEPSPNEMRDLLYIIRSDVSYLHYFFERVSDIYWFVALREAGYFNADNNPKPSPADQEGLYSIPQWNVLPYLERVSQQVSKPGSEKYIADLLAIIKDVSTYKNAIGQHIDNYRTWYYFAKILANLPTEKITKEIIDLIPTWLDTKFSSSLPGREITEKLLPKFLNSENSKDWEKAERLIEIITEIKWVPLSEAQRDIHKRDVEASTVIELHWLKKGMEKIFERIGTVCSMQIVYALSRRLLSIFGRQYAHSYDVNYEGNYYQITHALVEDGKHRITLHFLKYPKDWDGFSRNNIEKTLVAHFNISGFENKASFALKVKEWLIKKAFSSLRGELDEAISSIYSLHDYTYIGYSSLDAALDEVYLQDAEKILIYILREILVVKAKNDREETNKILDKFLSKEFPYPLFKRLILYVVANQWDRYKDYFFNILAIEDVACFEGSEYKAELSALLKKHIAKFSTSEKEAVRKIIEKGPQWVPDENPEKYRAYWKQKWLSLMKEDLAFALLFEEQKRLTGIEKEKFDVGSEVKVSHGFGQSPMTVEEIIALSNNELRAKLKEFRSEKKAEGMSVSALADALKEAVKAKPNKFIDNLSSFGDVGFIYIYKILDGLTETWREKKVFDWGKVFDFIGPYIKRDQFWKDEDIIESGTWLGGANHEWIIGVVAELIREGTANDAWAFSEEYFDKAEAIIFTLLRLPEEAKDITDYVTYTLNTPCGKVVNALVYLSLRIARANDKKGIKTYPKWSTVYKDNFDYLLRHKVIEASVSLGRFLPYLTYLDESWVADKVKELASDCGSKFWVGFMEGYLSIGKVYDDLYDLMNPHYRYGLSYDFKEKRNKEHLIQHICIGYLRGHERLDNPDSLFRTIVYVWKSEHIRAVLGFFWMQRDNLTEGKDENERMRGKIIEFWRLVFNKYKDTGDDYLSKEDKLILSIAGKLASLLSKIDAESYEWLMLSSPYVNEDFNSSFFIEYLNELKEKGDRGETAKYIGAIYLKMLEKNTPDYDVAHIRSIVEYLYDAGETENASKVCNIYGSRGHEFLRDLYDKYSRVSNG